MGMISKGLKAYTRGFQDFSGTENSKQISLSLGSGLVLFEYDNIQNRGLSLILGENQVNVIGTKFIVQQKQNKLVVLVEEGSVQVQSPSKTHRIEKNQILVNHKIVTSEKLPGLFQAMKDPQMSTKEIIPLLKNAIKAETDVDRLQKNNKNKVTHSNLVKIRMKDGEALVGKIITKDKQSIVIQSEFGESIRINRTEIISISKK